MKVLIDTNILLDVLCNRPGLAEASSTVMKYCETNQIEGYISALSFPNIAYILRKEISEKQIREVINTFSLMFHIADLKADDLKKAADLQFADYEDAFQAVCASRVKAQYIVTRNIKDFQKSKVPAIKPEELLERI